MQKVKSLNKFGLGSIIKSCLLGIIVTLIGVVVFAVVLKFTDLNTNVISWINNVIKAISIFIVILSIKKYGSEKLLLKSIVAGVLYALISYLIFSFLNKSFTINMSLVYDIIYAVIVSVIASIIINLFSKKTV